MYAPQNQQHQQQQQQPQQHQQAQFIPGHGMVMVPSPQQSPPYYGGGGGGYNPQHHEMDMGQGMQQGFQQGFPMQGYPMQGQTGPQATSLLVVDPLSRKMTIPLSSVYPTKALNATRQRTAAPSLCMLYQKGQCRQGQNCHQVHADPLVVAKLRKDALQQPTCCIDHGDAYGILAEQSWLDRTIEFRTDAGEVLVPARKIAFSKGMRRLMEENVGERISTPINLICRLHPSGCCRFGEDCIFLHVCRELVNEKFSESVLPLPRVDKGKKTKDEEGNEVQVEVVEGSATPTQAAKKSHHAPNVMMSPGMMPPSDFQFVPGPINIPQMPMPGQTLVHTPNGPMMVPTPLPTPPHQVRGYPNPPMVRTPPNTPPMNAPQVVYVVMTPDGSPGHQQSPQYQQVQFPGNGNGMNQNQPMPAQVQVQVPESTTSPATTGAGASAAQTPNTQGQAADKKSIWGEHFVISEGP